MHNTAKPTAEDIYRDACRVMPGGVSRNTIFRTPHPHYAEKASGCLVTDIEGVERLDFANNMASLIHGHAHPAIVSAVTEQLKRGTAYTMGTEVEVRYAQLLCSRNPGFEMIRFVNSGTEAVMGMLKAARAYTGRAKIAKAEGAYHGTYDYAEVSQTANPSNWGEPDNPASVPVAAGTPQSVLTDVITFPFNNTERTLAVLDRHARELACVLIDPMPHRIGLMTASADFIGAVSQWAVRNGVLLAFDEVITFRTKYGGAQELYGVRPDLTAMGKVIGGGFPAGALAGSAKVMKVFDPREEKVLLPYSGTFTANPITMTAGRTAMELFDRAAVERLNALSETARTQLRQAIAAAGIPASVTGAGSMFRIHLKPAPPVTYREAWPDKATSKLIKSLLDHAYSRGVMLINTCSGALSTVMTQAEIDRLSDAMLGAFRALKPEMEKVAGDPEPRAVK